MNSSISVKEAVEYSGIGRSRIYALVSKGELTAVDQNPLMLDALEVQLATLKHKAYHKKLWTPQRAADELGISRQSLYEWVARAKLKAADTDPLRVAPGEVARLKSENILTNARLSEEAQAMGLTADIRTLRGWLAKSRVYPRRSGRSNRWPKRALEVLAEIRDESNGAGLSAA